jgi:hypothetical protein
MHGGTCWRGGVEVEGKRRYGVSSLKHSRECGRVPTNTPRCNTWTRRLYRKKKKQQKVSAHAPL